MKSAFLFITNRFGFVWFAVGLLSILGLITCVDIFISLKEPPFLFSAIIFSVVGSFCLWVNRIHSVSQIKNARKAQELGIEVSADEEGFRYSDQAKSIAARWSEIRFMGVYQVLHFGYSKIYFIVVGDSFAPITIDCDLPAFGLLAERLYQHFPNLAWDWFYQFRLDDRLPKSRVIFGNGDSVAEWLVVR